MHSFLFYWSKIMQHVELLKFKQGPKWDCLSCQIGGHEFGVKPCQLKGLKIRLSPHSFILCHFYLQCQAANPPLSQTKGTVAQSLRGLWESLGTGSDLGGYSREMLDKCKCVRSILGNFFWIMQLKATADIFEE